MRSGVDGDCSTRTRVFNQRRDDACHERNSRDVVRDSFAGDSSENARGVLVHGRRALVRDVCTLPVAAEERVREREGFNHRSVARIRGGDRVLREHVWGEGNIGE